MDVPCPDCGSKPVLLKGDGLTGYCRECKTSLLSMDLGLEFINLGFFYLVKDGDGYVMTYNRESREKIDKERALRLLQEGYKLYEARQLGWGI